MNIKLNSIITAPWNTRGEITPESVAELAASIKEQGLINPITLWENADGEWLCIAGNRRLAAIRSLHADDCELPTHLYNVFVGDEEEAKTVTITENLQREDVGIIEEANAVAALLDSGKTVEWIAARCGESKHWVTRRRKLVALADGWKKRANAIDPDALEKIAAYPTALQEKLAKTLTSQTRWVDIKWYFEREMHDLDGVKFATKACAACEKRTGCYGDLFGNLDGKLGSCLEPKCFTEKLKAWQADAIAKATKGVAEVVRCEYEWQMPDDDELVEKRDKKHPCAYVYFDREGDLVVKFGESAAERKEREEAAERERAEEVESRRNEREREDAIREKLGEAFPDYGEKPAALRAEIDKLANLAALDENQSAFVAHAIEEEFCRWHRPSEWADILKTWPFAQTLAGLTDDDVAWFIERNADDEDDED